MNTSTLAPAKTESSLSASSLGHPTEETRQFTRINPLSNEVASSARAMTESEAVAVADLAALAYPAWAALGPNARRTALSKVADAILLRTEDFVIAMANETGATRAWATFNVNLAAGMIREAASLTTQISGEVIPSDKPGCLAMALREPVGVVLGIAPWNAPVILGVRAIVTALACGNAVVFKASEICPRTHELIVESFADGGLPHGVVGVVTNSPEDAAGIVGTLIDHPAIRRINFTGSTRVGRVIAVRAAQNLKPCLLELGGKAPMIVLEDADLKEAVNAAAFGAFFNSGQICMSTERLIVEATVGDRFVALLAEKTKTLVAGDPRLGACPLGAMADMKNVHHVNSLIDDALAKGAKLLCGGRADGVLMSATLLDHVTSEMRIYREESFGPILAIMRAGSESVAIQLANDSEYGLSAAVFTTDAAKGLRIARQVKSGIFHINGPTVHDEAQMPFGGVGASGYGKFGGKAGIDSFTELRWVTIETKAGHYPI